MSLPNDFPVPYLRLNPAHHPQPQLAAEKEQVGDEASLDPSLPNPAAAAAERGPTTYQCPLYGVADRHFSGHQSALLDFIHLKSDMESKTLIKRGAALLAVNA